MTKREQALVDQHRAWREQAAAAPEQPWATEPPERELEPREQRLAEARSRRAGRLAGGSLIMSRSAPVLKEEIKAVRTGRPIKVKALRTVQPPTKQKPKKRKQGAESFTTRTAYGNTVIRPWRRNNSGGWSRS